MRSHVSTQKQTEPQMLMQTVSKAGLLLFACDGCVHIDWDC